MYQAQMCLLDLQLFLFADDKCIDETFHYYGYLK